MKMSFEARQREEKKNTLNLTVMNTILLIWWWLCKAKLRNKKIINAMYDSYIVFIGSNSNYEYLMRTMKYSEEIMETKKNC